jgi:hypothetical protein
MSLRFINNLYKKKEEISLPLLYHQLHLFTPPKRVFRSQRCKELERLQYYKATWNDCQGVDKVDFCA